MRIYVTLAVCALVGIGGLVLRCDVAGVLGLVGGLFAGVRLLMSYQNRTRGPKKARRATNDPVERVRDVTGPGWRWDPLRGGLRPR